MVNLCPFTAIVHLYLLPWLIIQRCLYNRMMPNQYPEPQNGFLWKISRKKPVLSSQSFRQLTVPPWQALAFILLWSAVKPWTCWVYWATLPLSLPALFKKKKKCRFAVHFQQSPWSTAWFPSFLHWRIRGMEREQLDTCLYNLQELLNETVTLGEVINLLKLKCPCWVPHPIPQQLLFCLQNVS